LAESNRGRHEVSSKFLHKVLRKTVIYVAIFDILVCN